MKRLEKLRAFWEKHGYLCVIFAFFALVMTTAVLTRKPAPQPESPETTRYVLESTAPTPRPASVQKTVQPTATAAIFALPCEGKTGMVYAPDQLIYQQTLGEYAVHGGVDYLGQEGGVVRAVESGTVTRVWDDALMGRCVEISHRGGYFSLYASLGEEEIVQAEEAVSRGQIIGTMGTSAAQECGEGPHLHFELRRLREALDPQKYLKDVP